MISSILTSVKKSLSIMETDTNVDDVIMIHINSVFSRLNDLGIGPANGFMIEDDEPTWDDFLKGDLRLNSVKSYMYLVVKSLFDPSDARFTIAATTAMIEKYEWTLNVVREGDAWVDPEAAEKQRELEEGRSGWERPFC